MASLDIDSLLREISETEPCGDNLEYDSAFIALEEEAKGIPEKQIGGHIEPAVPPNWKSVRKQLLELLERTRDLRLLVELIRTELNLDGFGGLRDGLIVLRRSLESYWDTIHPQLDPDDDNDPTMRVNIIMQLCDGDAFLRTVLNAPLVESRAVGRFSLRQIQFVTGKTPPPTDEEVPQLSSIQAAFSDVEADAVLATHNALLEGLSELNTIENFVTQQVGVGQAPNFNPFRVLLKEAAHVVAEQLQRLGIGGEVSGFAGDEAGADLQQQNAIAGGGGARLPEGQIGGINNRPDVIRALDLICEYYAKHEPSSPVPLLAHRAKRLVTMNFMEILQDLAPDGVSQAELFKGQDPEG